MSKNNKNARRIRAAKEMSKTRVGGGKGPARTNPAHGKKRAWWQLGKHRKVTPKPTDAEADGTA